MSAFIPGKELCRSFFEEIARPLLERDYPGLRYTAGLLGYGSDVLGYDDEVSTDHMWGPRFYLFLRPEDLGVQGKLLALFSREFPHSYRGHSVHFSPPDPEDGGVRHAVEAHGGPVSPLIFTHTVDGFLQGYLGMDTAGLHSLEWADWLSFSEHRLLALRSADLYEDALDLKAALRQLHYYPREVQLYLAASCWALIGQEQAFVRRCADREDELGSRIIAGRIAERLMRLCFLYCGRYAPYSKWFGTAFARLPLEPEIGGVIATLLSAGETGAREEALVRAQAAVAELHNRWGMAPVEPVVVQRYFNRNIQVIRADKIAEGIAQALQGTGLEHLPPVGTMSQVGNLTELSDDPARQSRVKGLYGR